MKTLRLLFFAALLGIAASAFSNEEKSPAEWVAQLGADHLAEREAASAHLLSLGSKAREEVRRALDSPDPEVKFRARELWKTLRWQVIPGADADIAALVEAYEQNKLDSSRWTEFVKKYGAETLRLVAEFRAENEKAEKASDAGLRAVNEGLRAALDKAKPIDVARTIAESGDRDRLALRTLLNEVKPDDGQSTVNVAEIWNALWEYEKALDFAHGAFLHTAGQRSITDAAIKQAAIAIDRGKLFDRAEQNARDTLGAETDANQLCAELSFYVEAFSALGKRSRIAALCDSASRADLAKANDAALKQCVGVFFKINMPERTVSVLRDARTPLALYMRSTAHLRMRDQSAAEVDWRDAEAALAAIKDEKKEETFFSLGELMNEWRDRRAELMWQKILETDPQNSVYDANACFRLAAIAENRKQYSRAADFYEKGMSMMKTSGGILIRTGPNGEAEATTAEEMQQQIKKLRALAGHEE